MPVAVHILHRTIPIAIRGYFLAPCSFSLPTLHTSSDFKFHSQSTALHSIPFCGGTIRIHESSINCNAEVDKWLNSHLTSLHFIKLNSAPLHFTPFHSIPLHSTHFNSTQCSSTSSTLHTIPGEMTDILWTFTRSFGRTVIPQRSMAGDSP